MITRLQKAASVLFCSFVTASSAVAAPGLGAASIDSNGHFIAGLPESKESTDEPNSKPAEPGAKDSPKKVAPEAVERDLSSGWVSSTKAYNLAAPPDAKFKELESTRLELESGTILIEALKPTTVVTPMSEFQLKPKSLVLIRVCNGTDRALALLENAAVTTNKRSTEVRFGEQVLVTERAPGPAEMVGEERIGIRQIRQHPLGHDRYISIMEFSLVQATERIPIVSQVIHSGHAHDKALKQRLLKAAAVLNMVTSRHGGYSAAH